MNFLKRILRSKIDQVKSQYKDWQDPNREVNPVTCEEFSLEGITPALYAGFLAKAKAAGVKFDGDRAEIGGIELDFNYDAVSGIMNITPVKHPFYVGCDQIQNHIQSIVAKAKGAI
jgi:hypothetical protein